MKNTNVYLKKTANSLIFILALTLAWWIIALIVNDARAVPTPIVVGEDMLKIFYEKSFYVAYFSTLLRSFIGFTCSFIVGFVLAVISAKNTAIRGALSPFVSFIRLVPTMAIASLFWLAFLPSVASVLVCFTIVMPYVYSSSSSLLSTVSNDVLEMAKVYEIPHKKVISKIYIPSLKNGFINLLGTTFSFALKITVSSEVIMGAMKSLGGIIQQAQNVYFSPSLVMAVALWTVITGLVVEIFLSRACKERSRKCK